MDIQVIQSQSPVGSKVTCITKQGREILGTLADIGPDFVIINKEGKSATIHIDLIGAWEVEEYPPDFAQDTKPSLNSTIPNASVSEFHQNNVGSQEIPDKEPGVSEQNVLHPPIESNTTSSTPDLPEISTSSQTNEKSLRRLLEIDVLYKTRSINTKLSIKPPDFVFPTVEVPQKVQAHALRLWNRAKDKFTYAQRINELGAQYGRVGQVVQTITDVSRLCPGSPTVQCHLAYLYLLAKPENKTLVVQEYRKAAAKSKNAIDWFNLGVLTLDTGQVQLAASSFGKYFREMPLVNDLDTWLVYINLVNISRNYSDLRKIVQSSRDLSVDEKKELVNTVLFLLQNANQSDAALQILEKANLEQENLLPIILDALDLLDPKPEPIHETVAEIIDGAMNREKKPSQSQLTPSLQQGEIYKYWPENNFGFLYGVDGKDYFFNIRAVYDDGLVQDLENFIMGDRITVVFEPVPSGGDKKPVAVGIYRFRPIDEVYELALNYAKETEYSQAISQIRHVINQEPEYRDSRSLLEKWEKWQSLANGTSIPKGKKTYAKAKRVQLIEKDYEHALALLRQAIEEKDTVESAVKDYAHILASLDKNEEAVKFLLENRSRIREQESVDNILITFYQRLNQHEHSIQLLEKKRQNTKDQGKQANLSWQISNGYLKMKDYVHAEENLRIGLSLQPKNTIAMKNLAAVLSKQGKIDEAQDLLNKVLAKTRDSEAEKLLVGIQKIKESGQTISLDMDSLIDLTLSSFFGELSGFAQYFLDNCKYEGIAADRVQAGQFSWADINKLEGRVQSLGPRTYRTRSDLSLSAAKIISHLDNEGENSDDFYRYLSRSFAAMGNASIAETKHVDSARELYCESLIAYDHIRNPRKDDGDVINALVRYLLSTLGPSRVPLGTDVPTIDQVMDEILNTSGEIRKNVFDLISYLVYHSAFAGTKILKRLNLKSTWKALATAYLRDRGVKVESRSASTDFILLWDELRTRYLETERTISSELKYVLDIPLKLVPMENATERVRQLGEKLSLSLDKQNLREIRNLLEMVAELLKQVSFEEQERRCIQLNQRCSNLIEQIEENPTRLSVQEFLPLIKSLMNRTASFQESLYQWAVPDISLRLANEFYYPDEYTHEIEIQVEVENMQGRGPAESVELIIQEDPRLFDARNLKVRLDESLRGGDFKILRFRVELTSEAIQLEAFSITIGGHYRSRTESAIEINPQSFTIRLYPENAFNPIVNPYARYAEGGPVGDRDMFFGREEIIRSIVQVIADANHQSKSVIVYGQKRAGKSTVLHWLELSLREYPDIMVLNIGNIAELINPDAKIPYFYQILNGILNRLRNSVEDKEVDTGVKLGMVFPDSKAFYSHLDSFAYFREILEAFRRICSRHPKWRDVHIVLLIDEFNYIYDFIIKGRMSETFMKTWKALLQANFFSAVTFGQDVMTKIKDRFSNELGTSQDYRITYLGEEEARDLIDIPIRIDGRDGKSRYRERAIERILELTAGSPFYIQIICNRLVDYINEKRAQFVTYADINWVVKERLINGNNPLTIDRFENLLNSGDTSEEAISNEDTLEVLRQIAYNSKMGPCHRDSISCKTLQPIDLILNDLEKRDVISRDQGQFYTIRVGLLKEWLLAH